MPVDFTCPHCGSRTLVADELRGQSGPCAGCGRLVTVPAAGQGGPRGVLYHVARTVAVLLLLALVGSAIYGWWQYGPTLALDLESRRCAERLAELGHALEAYHDDHGAYPPPWLADAAGTPQHSWRVLLLPYVGGQDAYERYRFDEPWDGPHNRLLADDMPELYGCPASPESAGGRANYLAVVGAGLFFDPAVVRRRGDVTDAPSGTIVLVERADTGIHWMEPRDLPRDQVSLLVNNFEHGGLTSFHDNRVNVLLADGRVVPLSTATTPERIAAALTIAGGEERGLREAEPAPPDAADPTGEESP